METKEIEEKVLTHPLGGLLPPDHGWMMPQYDGLSIANLPATVAALLGTDLPGALQPLPRELWSRWLPGLRRVVLVVLDALGYRLLHGMWAAGEGHVFSRLADKGIMATLTSVFPSTTAAALFSLATGCPPAQHGWLAYEIYLRELGIAANAILLCPAWTRQPDLLLDWGLERDSLVTSPRLAERLAKAGVKTGAVLSAYLRNSGFTKMLYRGVDEVRGHRSASDLWVHLRHMLAETRGRRAFLTAYWGGLDSIGHAYGQDTDLWAAEFRTVSHLLDREFLSALPAEDREGTLLLITADHGMLRIPPEQIVTANEDRHLREHLQVPIMGESRAAFVYPRPGRSQAIQDYLEEAFPGWFAVVDSRQALEAGLMGKPVSDEAYARAGELLVLPRDDHALQRAKPSVPLQGRHGGLTPEEMLVPLIAARLDALD
jgi:predicted AlkP superfamily pyrophosphatase or phosphodiesterase